MKLKSVNQPALSEEEKHQVLFEFNNTAVDYPAEKTISQLFEEQVQRSPDNAALIGMGHTLTYSELNKKSSQPARLLREKGVAPDTIVAIMMERSIDMVVGILAILKAGGAYLPIDPGYPRERIDYILADSGAKILLSEVSKLSEVSEDVEIANLCESHKIPPTHPTHLSYIMYTSGSTGNPKGVMVEHRNVVRLVKNPNYVELSETTRILQTGAPMFDATTFEMWGALLNGGQLVLAAKETILDARKLGKLLKMHHINVLWLTSPLFNHLVQQAGDMFSPLQWLLVGGDVLSPRHINLVRRRNKSMKVVNGYGPTENTTFSTCYLIEKEFERDIPIGKPISNSTAYILDGSGELQPIGVEGELYVGGAGISRGYLNNPELTAEKFNRTYISYKTGDLARWLPDGNIEFLGRKDQQVKIRGFRIELEEIENKLLAHEDIIEAVVIAGKKENQPGEQQYLCAYTVSKKEGEIPGLRGYLARELPDYMIPPFFVQLDKIPLTPNGKVDKKSLPDPDPDTGDDYIAPRDETEKRLAEIWAEVLGIDADAVGIRSSFFRLGGHSLNAALVINKIREAFGVNIEMKHLFELGTVKAISTLIGTSAVESHAFATPIEPVEKKDYYPLSSAQKRLYLIRQIDKTGIGYNIPFFFQLEGEIDNARLEDTFKRLVNRHESLRTSFHMLDEQPVQRIHDETDFKIESPGGAPPLSLLSQFVRAFDLSRAPLMRVGLSELEPGKHFLMIDMHHSVSDGVSMGTFFREFNGLYEGRELPPLKLQYKDFAVWQNRPSRAEEIQNQENYWLGRFGDEIPVLDLPTDFSRPPVQQFEGNRFRFRLGDRQTGQLKQLGLETGATLYIVLLALFNVFLSKLSGQEDIVIGSPTAGRRHHDLENMMGMFVNTLALRNHPAGEKSFYEFLQEVKECMLQAFDNQDYQYEDLVGKIVKTRDISRNPLFDVMFALENGAFNKELHALALPGVQVTPFASYGSGENVSKFDMTFLVKEGEDDLLFIFEYSTHLFNAATAARYAGYFKQGLTGILEAPGQPLSGIEIIPEEEKRRILTVFNDTFCDYPKDKTIHGLFEEQVEKTPGNIALIFKDSHLSYEELNRPACQTADMLREKGLKPGVIVGMMMNRSIEMISGIFGILKAGGAYLPIDPTYPQERINYMLKDSGADILLTESPLERGERAGCVPRKLAPCPAAGLCYVIYTSGTTGRPKGVPVEHRCAVNTLVCRKEEYRMNSRHTSLQLFSYAFDGFVTSFFTPVISGAAVVLLSDNQLKDIGKIKRAVSRHCVTHFISIPVLFQAIMESLSETEAAALQVVTLAGDTVPLHIVEAALQKNKNIEIALEYGVTEGSVMSTIYRHQERDKTIKVGRPIWNTRLYILSEAGHIQPIGIPGELFISGAGLARGYLNRPELTAEKFNRIDKSYGAYRSYQTGDLARLLPDGNIEFLGRKDQQVKIRGFRIELEEIESKLLAHEDVEEAVVTVVKKDSEPYICAYFVSRSAVEIPRLVRHLSVDLPGYMIPSYFVPLAEIPLTPNGKIDRKSLPQPDMKTGKNDIPPRDETERKLADIWSTVLKIDKKVIGINADFFRLGGDSLKAAIAVNKVREEMGADIEMEDLFKSTTVKALAGFIGTTGDKPLAGTASIEPVEKKDYYPMSSAQKRLYAVQQIDKTGIGYNIPAFFQIEGEIDKGKFEDIFRMIITRHEILRTSFHMVDEQPVQRIHAETDFKIESPIINNFARPFDLSEAPLMRVGLLELETQKHLLMIDMHHSISDGISLVMFLQEFSALYRGRKPHPLKHQYKDFAYWQERLLLSEKIKTQETYWLNRFGDEIPLLNLPTDYVRPPVQQFQGRWYRFEPEKGQTGQLKQLGLEAGATLYMVLVAIFNIFLSKLCGQEDIVIGTPTAGRRHNDLQNIMGMFVNTLALRNYPTAKKSFNQLLPEVKENTFGALENQDYQYEDLVDKVVKTRDMSRNPLFDAVFALVNEDMNREIREMELPGLTVTPYQLPDTISKFDLTLFAEEGKDEIIFNFEYGTSLFKKESIERFARYFKRLVAGVLENPGQPAAAIEILPEEERHQILTVFNDTASDYPRDKTIHCLFEEQVEKTPENTALIFEDRHLSYIELNRAAGRVAGTLRDRGVKPDTIVAMMMDRSIEMITGIFGILKAGGAYLPIDPGCPRERTNFMLSDSAAEILLTKSPLERGERAGCVPRKFAPCPATNLCYVIYTSGTTGKPKGTLTAHYNVTRVVRDTNYVDITARDRILQLSDYAFDGSVFDIYGALLNGAALVMVTGKSLSAARVGEVIKREQVTVFFATTVLFNALIDLDIRCLGNIRKVLFGGERVSVEHVAKALEYLGTDKIIHVYGPTETTVYATYHFVRRIDGKLGTVPIGKPLANTTVYILDRAGSPVPIGVAGEIYIGGTGVARGYLNHPELTAEKFSGGSRGAVFQKSPPGVFYRTGDLGRWLPDGNIQFLGRIDHRQLPSSPNGKVDVKTGKNYIPPRAETEKKLVEIWSAVLKIDKEFIGIDADFFRLGGHSLKAAIAINNIREEIGADIEMEDLFKAPTVKALARFIGTTGDKPYAVTDSIEPMEKKEYYPMSSAQNRLYVIQQIDKTGIGYNLPLFFQIEGEIDKRKFEDTFKMIITRHEILRTSFHMVNDEPVQRIHAETDFKIECPIINNFVRPFDLSRAPLIRMGLLELETRKHLLMMDMHHSISDGVSTGIFLQEFSALYRGRELPPLKLQYKDFAHWQQRLFLSEEIEKQETYWLNRFSDEVPVLNLPADHVRPPVQQFEGGRYRFELEKGQTGQLKQLGLDAGATLYMVLTAIFNIFLSKLSGQEDIVVGTPTAGRRRNDLQNIMGMFVNTLALRNYPTGEKSFNQLLQEVKENTLSAFQNQDYQYEDLVDKVVKTRDMSRNPLFDAAFALVNEDMNRELREMELPGLTVTPHQFPETISKFDLTLFAEEGRHGITFNFEYGTSLFKKESIERFARYFKRLTAGVLENPAQPSAGIDILPEEEKHRVLTVFNDTAADYPRDKTIHQLFEEQAYLTPDRTVLTAQADHRSYRTHLTYRQLNESSNRPAHLLREKGVVPDTIVAMKMERSIDMIVVILAILKAGGAYLPIDPAYPQERMDYMLKDSGADILLTKSPLERGERAGCVPRKLAPCPATSLCYVIYTSGTTGKPKGTLTAHYNVTRVVRDTNYIDITAGDRVLQLSNYAFDGSVFDIYGALLNGAALVMVTGKGLSAARVGEVIKREQVTVFFVTTALFNALTDLDTRCLDNIRKVLFGGERVSVEHTAKALEYLGTDKIIHVYGPTETTVYATYHFVRRIDGKLGTVPIGKPLANTTAYILDRAGSPVPIGVAGEIYIGGPGVARGYLNHPELTAEKFSGGSRGAVFQKSPPGVFYRTGDLGRWLPDGDIQFLGRIDHQVKLRGFRVELGEIESRLLNHEQIKEAVVIDLLDPTGDKYLCAYIVPVPGETVAGDIDTGGLKNYLSQFLPGYMIPPYFIQLEQLPLTPNGKLNRKALPVPGTCEDREGYTAPAGELEKKLAALWAGVLGLEENTISADDNFFEKGGHSLKAGRLISRIHKTFDVKFSMAQVFDTPRLRDMAASIKAAATDRYIPIPGIEEKEFYPLSFNQERLWFIHQRNPQSPAFNMPDSLRLPGPAGETAVNAVKKTLAKIARRHESFRTGFKMIDDEPVQFIRPAVEIPVPVIDISSLPETEKEERNRQIFLEMSGNIFDLIAPPLLRALLVKHAPGGYDLLYNIHHIVSDGWSLELFKKEFFHFYERYTAEAEGNTAEIQPQIPQSVNRYKDFALWHRRRVEAEPVDGPSARFWEEQLAGGVPDLQLPRNLGSDNADVKGAGYRCLVAGDIKDKLNKLAADNHTSLFTVMFAVYILVLRRYSNQQEIVSSIINAGRNHDALSGIMGFFVNSLLFKIRVEDNEGFADFLRRVHGGVLESFKHQDYPPDLVVHRLNMRYPDIPVSFNMTNLGEDASQQEVEVFRAYHIPDSHDAKFDIEPYISEYKNGIDIWWSYKKSIFSPDTLEYFVTDYIKLLEYFCEHPQQSYRDFRATGKKRKFSRGQS